MKIYNFSAGPACLPETVLQAVKDAAVDYLGSGISVMEMSHRSKPIVDLFETASSRV
jgi:phosphoserine aminotransferase